MGYTLIISEKPTAAKRIAQALAENGVKEIKNHGAKYYKIKRNRNDIIVVPAVGHLFVLSEAKKLSVWKYPVFDVEWKPVFLKRSNVWAKKYYKNIEELSKNATEFISACDYDIEGSTIAFNILRFICGVEDGKRMKFSTLTKPDLIEAYEKASSHLDFPQIEAGLTRHQLDWYFGINVSRALTLSLQRVSGYWTLSAGRVQGPTLAILEKREREIESFVPKPFWEIELKGNVNGETITARHEKGKFWEKEIVEKILEKCKGRNGVVETVERKRVKQNPPFPFDLTSLQREAYALFKFSPRMTLDIAQTLYEKALISYPRTSSQKLPAKIGYKNILKKLSEQKEYESFCKGLLGKPGLKPNEGKKTDPAHPSIFPTGLKPKDLNAYQRKLYDLIARRFLSVFAQPAIREQMKIVVSVEGERFVTTGARTLEENWMKIYKPYVKVKEQILPDAKKGETVTVKSLKRLDKETQPPKRYTQASILKEMESLGLGTKATRAQILQTLYDREYIKEDSIKVTELGTAVINALKKYCPEIISVELTRKFEEEMEAIQEGKKRGEEILKEAEEKLRNILSEFKRNEEGIGNDILSAVKRFEEQETTIGNCKCGGKLKIIYSRKTHKRFVGCTNYPKCNVSFPLPQKGKIEILEKKCEKCGLFLISIKGRNKKWVLCPKCGFEKSLSDKMKR
ncbi:MAG: DNA topoisomerase I [Candidatus Aenigmatarchaeota archaeon]|nr:MAG: DNA topoisomerase I [Candidatus Aenigmarchaeota archaeon]